MADEQSKDVLSVQDEAKLQFEFFKHLTTLASGGGLFQIAVIEKFHVQLSNWVGLGVFGFGIAVLLSFVEMARLSGVTESSAGKREVSLAGVTAGLMFTIGCLGLIVSMSR